MLKNKVISGIFRLLFRSLVTRKAGLENWVLRLVPNICSWIPDVGPFFVDHLQLFVVVIAIFSFSFEFQFVMCVCWEAFHYPTTEVKLRKMNL